MGRNGKEVIDRLTRGEIHETVRHAYRIKIGVDPGNLRTRISDLQRRMLEEALSDRFEAPPDDLEKIGFGLVRMILLAHRDSRFLHLVDLSWNSAIIIARWADVDADGAGG